MQTVFSHPYISYRCYCALTVHFKGPFNVNSEGYHRGKKLRFKLRKASSCFEGYEGRCQSSVLVLDRFMSCPVFQHRSWSFPFDSRKRSTHILPTWSGSWEGQFLFEKNFKEGKFHFPIKCFLGNSEYVSGREVWLGSFRADCTITLLVHCCTASALWGPASCLQPRFAPVLLGEGQNNRYNVISTSKVAWDKSTSAHFCPYHHLPLEGSRGDVNGLIGSWEWKCHFIVGCSNSQQIPGRTLAELSWDEHVLNGTAYLLWILNLKYLPAICHMARQREVIRASSKQGEREPKKRPWLSSPIPEH